jgi:hypothetical protein
MIREESAGTVEIRQEDLAYRSGWEDGRFGSPEIFVANANLPTPIWLLGRSTWTGSPTIAATAMAGACARCSGSVGKCI